MNVYWRLRLAEAAACLVLLTVSIGIFGLWLGLVIEALACTVGALAEFIVSRRLEKKRA